MALVETGFLGRLEYLLEKSKKLNNKAELARSVGVTPSTLASVFNGGEPGLLLLKNIALALETTTDELIFGTKKNPNDEISPFVKIPRYNMQLSAGSGRATEDDAGLMDYIPFTPEFLQKKLGRQSTKNLVIFEAHGDSMQPTITDGALILIDRSEQSKVDGIYAFIQEQLARIKRLRFLSGTKIEIISDNNRLYPPEIISGIDLEQFQIIGRVRWIGHAV